MFSLNNLFSQEIEMILPIGHQDRINCLIFSNDGKYVLTGSNDNTIKLWDVNAAKELKTYIGHKDWITSITFLNDGEYFLSASNDNTVCLWNINQETPLKVFKMNSTVSTLIITKIGFITGMYDGTIRIFDLKGEEINVIKAHDKVVNHLEVTNNMDTLISCSDDKTIKIWNLNSLNLIKILEGNIDAVIDLDISMNSRNLYSFSKDNKIIKWDLISGEIIAFFEGNNSYLSGIEISNNDSILVSYSLDGIIKYWNTKTTSIIDSISTNQLFISDLKFSPNGEYMTTCSWDKTIKFWHFQSKLLINEFESYSNLLTAAVFSKDSMLIFSSKDGYIKVWNLKNSGKVESFLAHSGWIKTIAVSEDCKYLVSTSTDNTMKIWTNGYYYSDSTKTVNLDVQINSIAISSDNLYILTGNDDNTIKLWNLQNGELLKTYYGHKDAVTSVVFIKNKQGFISGAKDKMIKIWDINKDESILTLEGHSYEISSISISKDEKYLISASWDKTLKLWNIETGKLIRTFIGHKDIVNSVCFLSSKNQFISGSNDNMVILWDINNEKPLKKLIGHENSVNFVSSFCNDNFFISISDDFKCKVWDMERLKEVLSLTSLNYGRWIISNPDKYYYCPKESVYKIGFKSGLNIFDYKQFDIIYNRPDIILNKLNLIDSNTVNIYYSAVLKRYKKMHKTINPKNELNKPILEISNLSNLEFITSKDTIPLIINILDSLYNIDRVNVYVNEVTIYGLNGNILRDLNTNKINNLILNIPLVAGKNTIEVNCFNIAGIESLSKIIYINCIHNFEKPNLYLVSIGVSEYADSIYNLKYADEDALAITNLFTKGGSTQYGKVVDFTLLNEYATLENIQKIKTELVQTKVNDKIIVFFSGHGLLDDSLDYYLGTYNTNFRNPIEGSLPYDSLETLLDGIPARYKLLFIDACHSGELDKEDIIIFKESIIIDTNVLFRGDIKKLGMQYTFELMKELFIDLRRNTGTTVISSAGGTQLSAEANEWGNGAFTYCLLQGLQDNKAETDGEPGITVSEIMNYLETAVPELTKNTQQPTSRSENLVNDFKVW